jgi:hypothetical protein
MQRLTGFAAEGLPPEHGLDPVQFVRLGDCWKPHLLPLLLRPHMAGEIVFVQSVHDQHDRPRELFVEPAVKRVVVPLVGRLALRLRQRLLGL